MAAFDIPRKRLRSATVTMRLTEEERDILDAIAALEGLDGVSDVLRRTIAHFVATTDVGARAVEEVRRAADDRARRVDGKRQRRLDAE